MRFLFFSIPLLLPYCWANFAFRPSNSTDKLPQNTVTREKEIHVNPTSSHFTLRYPSIISVLGPQIPIIFPIFLVVPCGIRSFASKAVCLDPFRVVLILGKFQGVEALIFTVATTPMQVRLPVPQAGLFFSHAISGPRQWFTCAFTHSSTSPIHNQYVP